MSALNPKADIPGLAIEVCYVPKAVALLSRRIVSRVPFGLQLAVERSILARPASPAFPLTAPGNQDDRNDQPSCSPGNRSDEREARICEGGQRLDDRSPRYLVFIGIAQGGASKTLTPRVVPGANADKSRCSKTEALPDGRRQGDQHRVGYRKEQKEANKDEMQQH
jgi:hypothetical protein